MKKLFRNGTAVCVRLPAVWINHYICTVQTQNTVIMVMKYPPLDRKKMRAWRLNYTVYYQSERIRTTLQPFVTATIKNLAVLQGISCVISERHLFHDGQVNTVDSPVPGMSVDLVYFRSTLYSRVTRAEFRDLLSKVFGGYPNIFYDACPFEVSPQVLGALKEYPFPDAKTDSVIEVPLK